MAQPYIGQISIVGFNYAPRGYAFCNGQLMSIAQNQALFSILGTTYGGDGVSTFALPDLRGRAPMHVGANLLGIKGGAETVTLNATQIPPHTHQVVATSAPADTGDPTGALWAVMTDASLQYTAPANTLMAANAIGGGGSNQPHANMPPSTVLNFVIALSGIFPSRN